MKTTFTAILLSAILFPLSASATNLNKFNAQCTFLNNEITGTNTTGGPIIKADETAVHEFSVDLINRNLCSEGGCGDPNEFVSVSGENIVTSIGGSNGVADEDGDIYELKESLNTKTDIFTLLFNYFDAENGKIIGTSKIEYKCEILPFAR